jgi:GNAT superfamily N-acetyltransferase
VTVTPAGPEHTTAVVALLEEMDRFYGATEFDPAEVRAQQVRQALFTDPPAAYALLAWDGGDLVGIASYSFLWPAAGLTRSLYLKELYVRAERQRSGIGSTLMRALFEVAVMQGCSRVEWTTGSMRTLGWRWSLPSCSIEPRARRSNGNYAEECVHQRRCRSSPLNDSVSDDPSVQVEQRGSSLRIQARTRTSHAGCPSRRSAGPPSAAGPAEPPARPRSPRP